MRNILDETACWRQGCDPETRLRSTDEARLYHAATMCCWPLQKDELNSLDLMVVNNKPGRVRFGSGCCSQEAEQGREPESSFEVGSCPAAGQSKAGRTHKFILASGAEPLIFPPVIAPASSPLSDPFKTSNFGSTSRPAAHRCMAHAGLTGASYAFCLPDTCQLTGVFH
jgi:hypothetical protein